MQFGSIIRKLAEEYEERERNNPTPLADLAYLEELRFQEEKRVRQQQETREREQIRTQPARAFNASLCVPVRWQPNYKIVLSGLSARGAGNGQNRATVYHIQLLEDLDDSRLHRKASELLCSTNTGSYGMPKSDEERTGTTYQVTCQTCLRMAQRWQKV